MPLLDLCLPDLSDAEVRLHFPPIADPWARLGYAVLPAQPHGVKAPADGETYGWLTSAGQDAVEATMARWRVQYPGRDGLLLLDALPGSGMPDLDVVDVDNPADLPWAVATFGTSPLVVASGRVGGGYHLYFLRDSRRPRDERGSTTKVGGRAVDFKSWHGYVVAPGSVHRTGAVYTARWHGEAIAPAELTAEMIRALPILDRDVLDTVLGGRAPSTSSTSTSTSTVRELGLGVPGGHGERVRLDPESTSFRHGKWSGMSVAAVGTLLRDGRYVGCCVAESHKTDENGGTTSSIFVQAGRVRAVRCFACSATYVFAPMGMGKGKDVPVTDVDALVAEFEASLGDGGPEEEETEETSPVAEADDRVALIRDSRRFKPFEVSYEELVGDLSPLVSYCSLETSGDKVPRHSVDEEEEAKRLLEQDGDYLDSSWCTRGPHLHSVSGKAPDEVQSSRLACNQFGCEACGRRVVDTTAASAAVVVRRLVEAGTAWSALRVEMPADDDTAHRAMKRWTASGEAHAIGAATTPGTVSYVLLHREHEPRGALARHLARLGAVPVEASTAHEVIEAVVEATDLDEWKAHEGRATILRGSEALRGHVASLRDAVLGRSRAKLKRAEPAPGKVSVRSWTATDDVRREVGKRLLVGTTVRRAFADHRRRALTAVWASADGAPLGLVLQRMIDDGTVPPIDPRHRKARDETDFEHALALEMIA